MKIGGTKVEGGWGQGVWVDGSSFKTGIINGEIGNNLCLTKILTVGAVTT